MRSFYTPVNVTVKEFSAPRNSCNPFKYLTDEDVASFQQNDALVCRALDKHRSDPLLEMIKLIPYDKIEPHLMHGYLAESIFRKRIKLEGLSYENLRKDEKEKRRQDAAIQAYVDLGEIGVFDASVLKPFGDILPTPSPVTTRGRPAQDLQTMFRLVLLGCRYRLSDQALFDWLCESPRVRRYAGIEDVRRLPAPNTIWFYREAWAQHNSLRALFDEGLQHCLDLLPHLSDEIGKVNGLDGTFVDARKRHVSSAVHQQIVSGVDPVDIFENPAERRQRDVDARHTKKNNLPYFGFKTHTKACLTTKLITDIHVTPANVHDSQAVDKLVTKADQGTFILGDSAYNGRKQREIVEDAGATPLFMEKPSAIEKLLKNDSEIIQNYGRLLQQQNTNISQNRVRIEHIFGQIQVSFGGSFVRSVSLPRATAHQLMTACCYNAERTRYLVSVQNSS